MDLVKRVASLRYRCSQCNELHHGLPELSYHLPAIIASLDDDERQSRCTVGSDQCSLDGETFFIRCVLQLPIRDSGEIYGVGVWSTLSRENFKLYSDNWENPRRAGIGPFLGWFASFVETFEDTINLKCRVWPRDDLVRPVIELEPTDHPLALAQREGLELSRALEMAERIPGIKFLVK